VFLLIQSCRRAGCCRHPVAAAGKLLLRGHGDLRRHRAAAASRKHRDRRSALSEAAAAAEGSVAHALTLLGGDALKLTSAPRRWLATLRASIPRTACTRDALRGQRPDGTRHLHRQRRSLGHERCAATTPMQRQPSPPCTAGRRCGKRINRAARDTQIQSRAKAAGFLGSGCWRRRRARRLRSWPSPTIWFEQL